MTEQEGEELDFDVLSESWNKYRLEDGSILKIKNPAVKVFKTTKVDSLGNSVYKTAGTTLISCLVPKELKGTPSPPSEITQADIIADLKFVTISEEWCEYKVSDGVLLRAKTVLTKVSKTKKFNLYGEPLYSLSWQVLSDKVIPR